MPIQQPHTLSVYKPNQIEPELIEAFRSFTGLRLGIDLCVSFLSIILTGWPTQIPINFFVSTLDVGLLYIYLSNSRRLRFLRSFYLPIGILWATIFPVASYYWSFVESFTTFENYQLYALGWQQIPILTIPLLIIAWQYRFRYIVFFCLALAVSDFIAPVHLLSQYTPQSLPWVPIVTMVIARTFGFLFIGYLVSKMMGGQRRLRGELTEANSRLTLYAAAAEQLATSRERNRMARELHDILAHTLSGVAVELEAVRSQWQSNPEHARELLDHSLAATRSGLTETRRALQSLRASPLEDLGFSLALRNLAEATAQRAELQITVDIPEKIALSPLEEQVVYRILQEGLDNITRHAQARKVMLQAQYTAEGLEFQLQDDGVGFIPENINAQEQFGLRGMRERAEMVGAQLSIHSTPGKGALIVLKFEEKA